MQVLYSVIVRPTWQALWALCVLRLRGPAPDVSRAAQVDDGQPSVVDVAIQSAFRADHFVSHCNTGGLVDGAPVLDVEGYDLIDGVDLALGEPDT